jgi:hypothetical protein
MPKMVTLWEIDSGKLPADPNERVALMTKMIEMTKQILKEHPGSEWGAFIGEDKGYSTGPLTPGDIVKINLMFSPYVKFKVFQTISIDEFEAMFKAMQPKK